MKQRFLLAFLNQCNSEGLHSLTDNAHCGVQEGKLSLNMRWKVLSQREVSQTFLENQVMEKG
jgi:hypothetical protein